MRPWTFKIVTPTRTMPPKAKTPSRAKAKQAADNDDALDPVVAEYDIYLNPRDELDLFLCQYQTRSSKDVLTEEHRQKLSELRIKRRAGLIEVDVPLNTQVNYNAEKGSKWGEAMEARESSRAVGAQGLAGGFGVGAGSSDPRAGTVRRPGVDSSSSSRQQGGDPAALNKITYGGKATPRSDMSSIYMIGAFRGNELHLTPVDQIYQLAPHLHHIDASGDLDNPPSRYNRRDDTGAAGGKEKEAKAVQMTNKPVMDGEEVDLSKTVDTLKAFQEELWERYEHEDENSERAWTAYDQLYVNETEQSPGLNSLMSNEEYLDALSAVNRESALSE